MRDYEIRKALNATVLAGHHSDTGTRVIEEMWLCRGKGRIDIAVINGELSGIEIKSTRDTLVRLPRQIEIYSAIFDRVTLVASRRHLRNAKALIPPWWGLQLALPAATVEFQIVRGAEYNADVRASALVQLLWREEALRLLAARGEDRGVRTKAKKYVWQRLAEVSEPDQLRVSVRETIKLRQDWRCDPLSLQSGG
jgi:hypothetical protein